jgi:hypothetical protein
MRERMHELDGKLEMESDGHGTTIRAIVSLFAMSRTRESQDAANLGLLLHSASMCELNNDSQSPAISQ